RLLVYLGARASARKLRLFACAGCRRIWRMLPDEQCRRAVEVSERFADGLADADELAAAHEAALQVAVLLEQNRAPGWNPARTAGVAAAVSAGAAAEGAATAVADAEMFRDAFGNPFHLPRFDPAWLTPPVLSLARQAYDNRDFNALPILGDALEDAGC